MKRIIRLTESDLARIVRRVISEGTETTTMTPQKFTEIETNKGTVTLEAMIVQDNVNRYQDVVFLGTSGKQVKKDDKGNTTQTGNVYVRYTAEIGGSPIYNFYLQGIFKCDGTRVSFDNTFLADTFLKKSSEVTLSVGGGEFVGTPMKIANTLNNWKTSIALTYKGSTVDLVAAACKAS